MRRGVGRPRGSSKRPPTSAIVGESTPNLIPKSNAPTTPSTQLDPASRQLLQESRRASQSESSTVAIPGKLSTGKLRRADQAPDSSRDGLISIYQHAKSHRTSDPYEFQDARTPASPTGDEDTSTAPSPAIFVGSVANTHNPFNEPNDRKRKHLADVDVHDIKKWAKKPRDNKKPSGNTRGKRKQKGVAMEDQTSSGPAHTILRSSSVTLAAPSTRARPEQSPEVSATELPDEEPQPALNDLANEAGTMIGVADTDEESVAAGNGVREEMVIQPSDAAVQTDVDEDAEAGRIQERSRRLRKPTLDQEVVVTPAPADAVKRGRGRPRKSKEPENPTPATINVHEALPDSESEYAEPVALHLDDESLGQDGSEADIEVENWELLPVYNQGVKLITTLKAAKSYRLDENRSSYWKSGQRGELKPAKKLAPPISNLYRLCQVYIKQIDRATAFAADGSPDAPFDVEENASLDIVTKFDGLLKLTKSLQAETYNPADTLTDDDLGKHRKILTRQIYVYAIPMLTDVLEATINYNHRFTWSQNVKELELGDLSALYDLICVILSLDENNKAWADQLRPTSKQQLPAIKDLRDEVIVPLRQIKEVFSKHVRRLSREKALADVMARNQALKTRASQTTAQPRLSLADLRRKEERQQKDRRVQVLVMARMLAEPDVRIRLDFHRYNGPPAAATSRKEIPANRDANGENFERVSMFGQSQRAQPEPRYVLRYGEEAWTEEEELVLLEALETFAGPNLWPQVIAKHCRYRGILRYRTISEMLRYAAYMRATFMRRDADTSAESIEDVVTEDWIVHMPDLDLIELM